MADNVVVEWRDGLLIGEPVIDAQHRRLVELIAGISDHPQSRDPALIAEALAYAATHFADEEGVMERIGFPGLARHRHLHKTLTRTLLAYQRQYENGETDLYSFKHFLFRWVRDHIMEEDQQIGAFLAAQRGPGP